MAIGPLITKRLDAVAITAGTPITAWTPASGKRFRLEGWALSSSAAASLFFLDDATALDLATPLLAAAGIDRQSSLGDGVLSGAADRPLKIDATATATISGSVWGREE